MSLSGNIININGVPLLDKKLLNHDENKKGARPINAKTN